MKGYLIYQMNSRFTTPLKQSGQKTERVISFTAYPALSGVGGVLETGPANLYALELMQRH